MNQVEKADKLLARVDEQVVAVNSAMTEKDYRNFLEEYIRNGGYIHDAAVAIDKNPRIVYQLTKDDPVLKIALKKIREFINFKEYEELEKISLKQAKKIGNVTERLFHLRNLTTDTNAEQIGNMMIVLGMKPPKYEKVKESPIVNGKIKDVSFENIDVTDMKGV